LFFHGKLSFDPRSQESYISGPDGCNNLHTLAPEAPDMFD